MEHNVKREPPLECPLLALPAELRNHIYRYVLVEPDDIWITPQTLHQPAIMSVCTWMRGEAGPIYHSENTFRLIAEDYKGASFVRFTRLHEKFASSPEDNVTWRLVGPPNWDNLVAWIRTIHFDNTFYPDMELGDGDIPDEYVMAGAMQIYEALEGLEWSIKEAALKGFYQGLRGTQSEWVKYEDRVE